MSSSLPEMLNKQQLTIGLFLSFEKQTNKTQSQINVN